jgi:deoxyribonuclease-4
MIVFATAGKPLSFGKRKYPDELPDYLTQFGLNGFEVQFGRGINITKEAIEFFKNQKQINLSVHSPYFISISSIEEEKRENSVRYILETAKIAHKIGAERVIVHSGSCAKISREQALELALETLKKARRVLDENNLEQMIICPETMGKINQLGTLDEVLELCSFDERMLPCVDFGHLNARAQGKINYKAIFDKIERVERFKNFHIHFSKIEYSEGGEKKHLTFEDRQFGPDFEPMLDEIASRGLEPFIVCESAGTQAEDCSAMRKYYEGKLQQ